jgi:hypothetical protein
MNDKCGIFPYVTNASDNTRIRRDRVVYNNSNNAQALFCTGCSSCSSGTLQQAIDKDNRLQGISPSQGKVIQYIDGQIVWSEGINSSGPTGYVLTSAGPLLSPVWESKFTVVPSFFNATTTGTLNANQYTQIAQFTLVPGIYMMEITIYNNSSSIPFDIFVNNYSNTCDFNRIITVQPSSYGRLTLTLTDTTTYYVVGNVRTTDATCAYSHFSVRYTKVT